MKFSVLPFAHPGLDLSAHRAELSVINTPFLFFGRDVVAYGTVAVDVIDIALRRMIGLTFLGHNTPPSIATSFASVMYLNLETFPALDSCLEGANSAIVR